MTPDLTCIELVELVTDHLELRLDPAERQRFEDHLVDCDDCAAYLDQMRLTIRLTGTLRRDELHATVLDALTATFRDRARTT
jgi:anti-sigma factor RsiW